MTNPSLTYGHGWLTDCDDGSGWSEGVSGMTADQASLTVEHGDVFKLTGICDSSGDEKCWYTKTGFGQIPISTYSKFLLRWKTSVSSNGLGARVRVMGDGDQWLLGAATPQFDTSWHLTSGSLNSGTYIDTVHFYADDHPDSWGGGGESPDTSYVYYDFLLLHKGTFTFPFVNDVQPVFEGRYVDLVIPGRVGDISQYLGAPNPSIRLTGKIDIGADSDWGLPPLQHLIRVWQEAHNDPWQWFSTGGLTDSDRIINCKVTLRKLDFAENKEATRDWILELKHYSLSSGDETTWSNLQFLGI